MTSRSVRASTWSRIAAMPAVPSLASVWMCRSARPRRGVASVMRRPLGRPVCRRGPAVGRRAAPASASRSGQIGKKTAHHWSGASAMRSSNAAASRVIVVVTRSRRVPSAGTSIGMILPRKCPSSAARRTVIPYVGTPVSTASIAGPIGMSAGAPKSGTRVPPPVRSRSPTSPTGMPLRSACVSSRRASRRPTSRIPATPRVRSK